MKQGCTRTHLADELTLVLSPLKSFLRIMERADVYWEITEVADQLVRNAEERVLRLVALIECRYGPMEVVRRGGAEGNRGREPVDVVSGWDQGEAKNTSPSS